MNSRILIFIFAALPYLYQAVTLNIIDRKRKEPLPEEVADVYTKERWETFIAEKHDMRKPLLVKSALSLCMSAFLIFSPFFSWMEGISSNIYAVTAVTVVILTIAEELLVLPVDYYAEMVVRTKYGLNKKDNKEFMHDVLIDLVTAMVMMMILYLFGVFVLEHLRGWTNGFHVSIVTACLLSVLICGAGYLVVMLLSWISWQMMRKQYVFTDLAEGELRTKIMALTEGAKKKIRKIEVYNESKKSTGKNAFMFRFFNYRSFGIADNFLNENSQGQLLAVLSHEAGHLKHKKNILNYVSYVFFAVLIAVCAYAMTQGEGIAEFFRSLMNDGFGLKGISYILVFEIFGWVGSPLFSLFSVFSNYKTRWEEYEADRNAVKEGYGEELISTFKELSSDELVDVNPADIIEFLEYDHPGMYHRIKAIREAMK